MTEVAEEHIAERGAENLLEEVGRHRVVEVSALGGYPGPQIKRVGAVVEHIAVVVALDHDILSLTHVVVHTVGDTSEVGGHGKSVGAMGDEVAAVVGAIVAHIEGGDFKIANLEGELLVQRLMVVLDASGDAVPPEQSVESFGGAIYADMGVFAHDGIHVSHMVAMVVGEEDAFDVVDG